MLPCFILCCPGNLSFLHRFEAQTGFVLKCFIAQNWNSVIGSRITEEENNLNVICARMHKDMKTRVMVKHCKSNSYNCDQCEYHRSSVDASVKTQTYKEDQVWHGQGTRKIHELWALVLAGRLYIYEWKKEANFPFRWMPSGRIVARRVVRYHRGHWGIT